jgi:hypothetical protein
VGHTSQKKQIASGTSGTAMAMVGAAAISLPLVIVGMKLASDATVIQHNLAEKELYKRTLPPGQNVHGFVYYPFPKDTAITGRHRFVVELIEPTSGEATSFVFNFK